jgi:hypothetical protein
MEKQTEDELEMELVELWNCAKSYDLTIENFLNWEETKNTLPKLIEIWKDKHELMLEFNRIKRLWESTKKELERKDRQLTDLQKKFEEIE